MYKGASRNLQHSHRVNAPMPTGGLMGLGSAIEQDFIPSAGNMSLEECRNELRQLSVEQVRAEQELAIAKRGGRAAEVMLLGHRLQAIIQRRSPLKQRIQSLREQAVDPGEILAEAVRDIATPELQKAIFERARALNKARFGE